MKLIELLASARDPKTGIFGSVAGRSVQSLAVSTLLVGGLGVYLLMRDRVRYQRWLESLLEPENWGEAFGGIDLLCYGGAQHGND